MTAMSTRSRRRKEAAGKSVARPATVSKVVPLYRDSLWFFVIFAVGMVVAFWPSYYSRLGEQPTYHPHAHGLAMTLWVCLIVAQACLIHWGYRKLHATLGLFSYVLVPLIVVATVNFVHFRARGAQDLSPFALHFLALVLVGLVVFVTLWALALYYRRQPATHARYMIATVFPLFTPVTDRLIGQYAPSIVPLVPRIGGAPILPFAGFLLADVLLAGLAFWDWQANRRKDVFPVALVLLLLYHVSVMTLHRMDFWKSFGIWFANLPLS
jgi:hypothetical protein